MPYCRNRLHGLLAFLNVGRYSLLVDVSEVTVY